MLSEPARRRLAEAGWLALYVAAMLGHLSPLAEIRLPAFRHLGIVAGVSAVAGLVGRLGPLSLEDVSPPVPAPRRQTWRVYRSLFGLVALALAEGTVFRAQAPRTAFGSIVGGLGALSSMAATSMVWLTLAQGMLRRGGPTLPVWIARRALSLMASLSAVRSLAVHPLMRNPPSDYSSWRHVPAIIGFLVQLGLTGLIALSTRPAGNRPSGRVLLTIFPAALGMWAGARASLAVAGIGTRLVAPAVAVAEDADPLVQLAGPWVLSMRWSALVTAGAIQLGLRSWIRLHRMIVWQVSRTTTLSHTMIGAVSVGIAGSALLPLFEPDRPPSRALLVVAAPMLLELAYALMEAASQRLIGMASTVPDPRWSSLAFVAALVGLSVRSTLLLHRTLIELGVGSGYHIWVVFLLSFGLSKLIEAVGKYLYLRASQISLILLDHTEKTVMAGLDLIRAAVSMMVWLDGTVEFWGQSAWLVRLLLLAGIVGILVFAARSYRTMNSGLSTPVSRKSYMKEPTAADLETSDSCIFCLEDLIRVSRTSKLRCSHVFHTRCVYTWVAGGHFACPLCKWDMREHREVDSFGNVIPVSPDPGRAVLPSRANPEQLSVLPLPPSATAELPETFPDLRSPPGSPSISSPLVRVMSWTEPLPQLSSPSGSGDPVGISSSINIQPRSGILTNRRQRQAGFPLSPSPPSLSLAPSAAVPPSPHPIDVDDFEAALELALEASRQSYAAELARRAATVASPGQDL